MKATTAITIAALAIATMLHGCAAGIVAPVLGVTNLAKNGPIFMTMEGKGDGMKSFKQAVLNAGGTVPRTNGDYAEAQFASKAVRSELQGLGAGRWAVNVTTTAARSWDFEDSLAKVADAITGEMGKAGFVMVERRRESGL